MRWSYDNEVEPIAYAVLTMICFWVDECWLLTNSASCLSAIQATSLQDLSKKCCFTTSKIVASSRSVVTSRKADCCRLLGSSGPCHVQRSGGQRNAEAATPIVVRHCHLPHERRPNGSGWFWMSQRKHTGVTKTVTRTRDPAHPARAPRAWTKDAWMPRIGPDHYDPWERVK